MPTENGVSLANPAPLGLAGFGVSVMLLSLINAGVLPPGGTGVVVVLGLVFGGLAQLIAATLEFKTGNTFGMTVFGSFAAFWLFYGLLHLFAAAGLVNLKGAGTTIGAALLLYALLATGMWLATFRMIRVMGWTFIAVIVALVLLGLADVFEQPSLTIWGGWVGILVGAGALYMCFAQLLSAAMGRSVLPVGERSLT